LVCAGGGVTGAVYEIGCLRALEDLLDISVLDFDLYVGVSGGAFVASLLAAGLSPVEMYDEVTAGGRAPFGGRAPLFRLGLGDVARRSLRAPRVMGEALWSVLTGRTRRLSDLALSVFELLPAGLLDNSGLQEYLAEVLARLGQADTFDALARELYVVAVDIDTGGTVAFGEPGYRAVPVSRAVQASTALPGLYRPVRIDGRDYVDGGVKKTAHINRAILHGADLVVCINPIVPVQATGANGPFRGHLSNKGVTHVLDQSLRIMLHGRMENALERYQAEHPEVDILVLEPAAGDLEMFSYNIMRYSARRVVAQHGYRSVRDVFAAHTREHAKVLKRHRVNLRPPSSLPETPAPLSHRSEVARRLATSLSRLELGLGARRS
jgi:predicted acylesterase/phospholipase RssA